MVIELLEDHSSIRCQTNIGRIMLFFRRPNLTKHPAHFTVAGCFALPAHIELT
jgi:hypothetical protein